MKSFLSTVLLLFLATNALADENCGKIVLNNYFTQSDALIEAFYKADTDSKSAPTAELRREAAIRALELSREMDPQIKSLRRQEAMHEALTCK